MCISLDLEIKTTIEIPPTEKSLNSTQIKKTIPWLTPFSIIYNDYNEQHIQRSSSFTLLS